MVHGLASIGYFGVKKTMLWGGGSYAPECTSGAQSRAGCPSSPLLVLLCPAKLQIHISGPTALPGMCFQPTWHVVLLTSIFQVSNSFLFFREVYTYPASICGLLRLACLSLCVVLMSLFVSGDCKIPEGRALPALSTSTFPGTVHAMKQNVVNIC